MDQPSALTLRALRKAYGDTVAVDSLDLDVPAGTLFGVVGPNGAGKTTTLRMATGLLRPDAGEVRVQDVDLWAEPVEGKRRLGVVPDELRLFERLSGRQLLVYTGLLHGLGHAVVEERAQTLLEVMGLADDAGKLVADYSAGMRRKVALAAALVHGPELLLLDEPFESVDPVSARTIREVLDRHLAAGGTVVLSSHVMELVERLCDHVAVLHEGRVVARGPLDEVRGDTSLEEAFVGLVGVSVSAGKDLEWLGSSSG